RDIATLNELERDLAESKKFTHYSQKLNKSLAVTEQHLSSLKVISRILGINIISDEFATLLNNIKNATITLTNINKPSTQQLPLAGLTPKLPAIDDKFEKFISNHKQCIICCIIAKYPIPFLGPPTGVM
ncbi:20004_t:CDS:2, partial [Gigaspora rosea]